MDDFHRHGRHLFAEKVSPSAASDLLADIRATRRFDANLFQSEAAFDANPQYTGVNPRAGRNLLDRFEDAEAAFAKGEAGFAGHPGLLSEHVAVATRQGDWALALRRAEAAAALHPRVAGLQRLVRKAESQLLGQADGSEASGQGAGTAGQEGAEAAAAFIAGFESLGAAKGGCDFGLLQRSFGVEQLGLLKWANIPAEGLTRALLQRFDGVGTEAGTELTTRRVSADHQEYCLADRTYSYWSHTFVKVDEMPRERMLKQSLRRLTFLKDKLMEDLAAAEKTFVYKSPDPLDDGAVARLFDAIRGYGPAVLLCVTSAGAATPPCSIEMRQPGLFVGHAALSPAREEAAEGRYDAAHWLAFCRHVVAWRDAQHAPADAAAPAARP